MNTKSKKSSSFLDRRQPALAWSTRRVKVSFKKRRGKPGVLQSRSPVLQYVYIHGASQSEKRTLKEKRSLSPCSSKVALPFMQTSEKEVKLVAHTFKMSLKFVPPMTSNNSQIIEVLRNERVSASLVRSKLSLFLGMVLTPPFFLLPFLSFHIYF